MRDNEVGLRLGRRDLPRPAAALPSRRAGPWTRAQALLQPEEKRQLLGCGGGHNGSGESSPGGGMEAFSDPTSPPGHDRHSMSSPEPLTDLGLNLALNNTHSGLPVNTQSCSEGHLRIILVASRGGAGWLWIKAEEADFSLSTLWALGLLNH